MTHDELTEQVARAIHAAEIAYGHDDLEPFDELDPSTRGLAMAYAEADRIRFAGKQQRGDIGAQRASALR